MAIKIVWSPRAVRGLDKVIEYLEDEWTAKEIRNLEKNLKNLLERIRRYPEICPPTGQFQNMHKGLVDKNNYIIYRIRAQKGVIEIINFRGTRQKPRG